MVPARWRCVQKLPLSQGCMSTTKKLMIPLHTCTLYAILVLRLSIFKQKNNDPHKILFIVHKYWLGMQYTHIHTAIWYIYMYYPQTSGDQLKYWPVYSTHVHVLCNRQGRNICNTQANTDSCSDRIRFNSLWHNACVLHYGKGNI